MKGRMPFRQKPPARQHQAERSRKQRQGRAALVAVRSCGKSGMQLSGVLVRNRGEGARFAVIIAGRKCMDLRRGDSAGQRQRNQHDSENEPMKMPSHDGT